MDWVDVFIRRTYKNIILGRLRHRQKEKGLIVYAYVIMSNHVHLIMEASKDAHAQRGAKDGSGMNDSAPAILAETQQMATKQSPQKPLHSLRRLSTGFVTAARTVCPATVKKATAAAAMPATAKIHH